MPLAASRGKPLAPAQKLHAIAENLLSFAPPAAYRPAIPGGMQKPSKNRWSLPARLRSEGWWLVDPPRAGQTAAVIAFARKNPPAVRLEIIGKALT